MSRIRSIQGVLQGNGYIQYSATLAGSVGQDRNANCNATSVGSVIYNPANGQVVTQYPGN